MWVAVAHSGLWLAACGGGAPGPEPTQTQRETAAAEYTRRVTQSNLVVTAASGTVRIEGGHQDIVAPLARGASVKRGSDASTRFHFAATLPAPGDYQVYAWWPQAVEGAGRVNVRLRDALGEVALELDQSEGGGQWVSLGVFRFGAGQPARVSLSSAGTARVVADALRFEQLTSERAATRVDTQELPLANELAPYDAALEGAGRPPLRWAVATGRLPPGLTLDAGSGRIHGLPAATGEYRFEVTLADGRGQRASRPLQIDVLEALDAPAAPASPRTRGSERRLESSAAGGPNLGALIDLLDAAPEGSWVKANLDSYSSVWTPPELRPLMSKSNPDPSNIIQAWSSFAWDPNRGDLWIYGGGHANYGGNDVYRWRGTTRLWERASLPSQIRTDDLNNVNAIDGVFNAPTSAHTYDNTEFLPIADRVITFGGATFGRGGPYRLQVDAVSDRLTGPYIFDPSRADASKVGGTTGSHVQRVAPYPEIVGGQMWSNRDMYGNQPVGTAMPTSFINGCSGYAEEGGRDVVYAAGRAGGTALALYKFTLGDLANPSSDVVSVAGRYWTGTSRQTSCAVDPNKRVLLRTGENAEPFFYWDLAKAGSSNRDVPMVPTDPTGEFEAMLASGAITIYRCGMDFDPLRKHYSMWCAGGTVWTITAPEGALSPTGWTVRRQPAPVGATPTADFGKGILGKWKYVRNLDAFMGLQDIVHGNVWLYKPVGWQRPGSGGGTVNQPPSVSMAAPADGAAFTVGQPIELQAEAADPDGSVAKVEFFNGIAKIGETTAGPPYALSWTTAAVGTHTLRAVAIDNLGAATMSAPITVVVSGGGGSGGTVVLQDGVAGYSGTRDTYLSSYYKARAYGSDTKLTDQRSYYTDLIRFAIFDHEGGPVPGNALISSARLMLYKYSDYHMRYQLHAMRAPWTEGHSTWNERAPGVAWGAPGARLAGVDYESVHDAVADVGDAPAWLDFDVTAAVTRMRDAPLSNHGWMMLGVSGWSSGLKRFYTREFTTEIERRPKLELTYTVP